MKYIGTTCLISETSKPRPAPRVLEFMKSNTVVVPSTVITEIERGILRVAQTSPERAAMLRLWFTGQPHEWPVLHGRERDAARLLAAMLECKPLRRIWLPQPKAHNPKLGHHLFVAASAIAYELPVATVSTGPLSMVHEFFPLPGIFCAKDGNWSFPASSLSEVGRPVRPDVSSAA